MGQLNNEEGKILKQGPEMHHIPHTAIRMGAAKVKIRYQLLLH